MNYIDRLCVDGCPTIKSNCQVGTGYREHVSDGGHSYIKRCNRIWYEIAAHNIGHNGEQKTIREMDYTSIVEIILGNRSLKFNKMIQGLDKVSERVRMRKNNFWLAGICGSGKTTIALDILRECRQYGLSVDARRFKTPSRVTVNSPTVFLFDDAVRCVDGEPYINGIVNQRSWGNRASMIFTSNLSPQDVFQDHRLIDRLNLTLVSIIIKESYRKREQEKIEI